MRRAFSTIVAVAFVSSIMAAEQWTDPSPHAVSFVGIAQGVALEVLDWAAAAFR